MTTRYSTPAARRHDELGDPAPEGAAYLVTLYATKGEDGFWRNTTGRLVFPIFWEQFAAEQPAREEAATRPTIVCLCGSTRFYREFQEANYRETMAGKIVLTVGFFGHSAGEAHGESVGITPEQKVELDELHKRKIDLADEILVINVGGYIGESTRSEIEYALQHGKQVRHLEQQEAPAK